MHSRRASMTPPSKQRRCVHSVVRLHRRPRPPTARRNCCRSLCRFRWLTAPRPSPAEWTYPATIQLRIVVPLRSATGEAVLSQRPVQLDFPLPWAIPAQCAPARQLDHVTPHCRRLPSATSPTPTVVGADDVGRAMLANAGTISPMPFLFHRSPRGRRWLVARVHLLLLQCPFDRDNCEPGQCEVFAP